MSITKARFIGLIVILIAAGVFWFVARSSKTDYRQPKNDTIIAFGDSLVEGVGAPSGSNFVDNLSRDIGMPIINMGISGNTTIDGLARIDQVVQKDPGIVILLLGGNDYLKKIPQQQTFDNLNLIIKAFKARNIRVLLIGIRGGLLNDHFEDSFTTIAEINRVPFVPDALQGLFGHPELMSDSVHPNAKGYAILSARILPVLQKMIHSK